MDNRILLISKASLAAIIGLFSFTLQPISLAKWMRKLDWLALGRPLLVQAPIASVLIHSRFGKTSV